MSAPDAAHSAEKVRCPYCGSRDVHNCGDVVGDGTWHLECNSCWCCSTVTALDFDGSQGAPDA